MRLAIAFAVTIPLLAQDIGVPVMGAAVAGTPATLRRIVGIPGAAVLGDSLASGPVLLAPGHSWAVVETADAVNLVVLEGNPVPAALPGLAPGAALRSFSPKGATLASYYADSGRLVIAAGLPGAPKLSTVAIPTSMAAIQGLTVSESGSFIIAADATGAVFRWDGNWAPVAGASGVSAVQLLAGQTAAVLLDASRNKLLKMDASGTLSDVALLPVAVTAPVAVSLDDRTAVICAADGTGVLAVDLGSGSVNQLAVDRAPKTISAGASGTFTLTADNAPGAWMLDPVSLKVSFIPVARAGGE